MLRLSRRRYLSIDLTVLGVIALLVVVLVVANSGSSTLGIHQADTVVTIGKPLPINAIPSGFLGLSLEYSAVTDYAGTDARELNPVFLQLIRNLTPGQAPVLRIGGDTADWTWWPIAGVTKPPGVTFTLTPAWIDIAHELTTELGARLILGLNMEADNVQVAAAEAQALLSGVGATSIRAFELGNEPELYATFPWYRKPGGKGVYGRPRSYGFKAFLANFIEFAQGLPDVVLAGPEVGGPGWSAKLAQFLAGAPRIGIVTIHRYPLQVCFVKPGNPIYPSIPNLLDANSSTGLADFFAPYVAIARAHKLPLRVDELNSVSCGPDRKVSQTFASALWSLDTLFEMARVGVDGVNIHTFPSAGYNLFAFTEHNGRWSGAVAPEYYGLLMFAQAAAPGSLLLDVSGQGDSTLKTWATQAPNGTVHVVVINKSTSRSRVVAVRVPGLAGTAQLERLSAPSAQSSDGVTLGGRSFGAQTTTGTLAGAAQRDRVSTSSGAYVLRVPAASAAMLTLAP